MNKSTIEVALLKIGLGHIAMHMIGVRKICMTTIIRRRRQYCKRLPKALNCLIKAVNLHIKKAIEIEGVCE